MQKYQNNVLDRSGNAVSGVQITVNLFGGGLATIYSDNGITTAPNPLTTDANGYFEFYAADGRYNVVATGGGYFDVMIADVLLIAGAAAASEAGAQAAQAGAVEARGDAIQAKVDAQAARDAAVPAAATATAQAVIATDAATDANASKVASAASEVAAQGYADGAQAAAGNANIFATWAELEVVAGTTGQGGQVIDDPGTHADPVTSDTVSNTGQYLWNDTESAWEWKRGDVLASKADKTEVDRVDRVAERSSAVTDQQIRGGYAADAKTDGGFNPLYYFDQEGGLVSPSMPRFVRKNVVRGLTWGKADKNELVYLGTGPASLGFPIRNPHLENALERRLGRAPLIAFDGDSRPNQGLSSFGTSTYGIQYWLGFLSGGRFDIRDDLNFAIGGQTSTQVVARVAATIAACRAAGCTLVIAWFSLNDRGQKGTGNDGSTAAVSIANMAAYQKALLDAGIDVIWIAELPCGSPAWHAANPGQSDLGLTATAIQNQLAVRRWQLAQPKINPRVSVADPFPLLIDPTSANLNFRNGVSKDDKHQAALGAYLAVQKTILPIIEQRLPPWQRLTTSAADVYSANNPGGSLLSNTVMQGTAGTFAGSGTHTGTLPDGWGASISAGINADFTRVSDDAGDWLQAVLSGTAPSASWLTLTASASLSGFSAAGEVIACCEQEVDAGHPNLTGIGVRVVLTGGGQKTAGAVNVLASPADINVPLPDVPLAGVAVTPPLAVTGSGVTAARIDLLVQGLVGTVSATLRWRYPSINRLV